MKFNPMQFPKQGRTVIRQVGAKRARKLRRLGESVYWSVEHDSLVWHMTVGLHSHQREEVRRLLNWRRSSVFSDLDYARPSMAVGKRELGRRMNMPDIVLGDFNIKGTYTGRLTRAVVCDPETGKAKVRNGSPEIFYMDFSSIEKRILEQHNEDTNDDS